MSTAAEALSLMPAPAAHDLGATGLELVALTLRAWHDRTHPFAFSMCREQPCHAVGMVLDEACDAAGGE